MGEDEERRRNQEFDTRRVGLSLPRLLNEETNREQGVSIYFNRSRRCCLEFGLTELGLIVRAVGSRFVGSMSDNSNEKIATWKFL